MRKPLQVNETFILWTFLVALLTWTVYGFLLSLEQENREREYWRLAHKIWEDFEKSRFIDVARYSEFEATANAVRRLSPPLRAEVLAWKLLELQERIVELENE